MTLTPYSEQNAPVASGLTAASLDDQVAMLDQAYARGHREACIRLVDELYAFFDKAVGKTIAPCAAAAYVVLDWLAGFV